MFFVRSSKHFFVRFCEFSVTIFELYNLMETHFVTQFDTHIESVIPGCKIFTVYSWVSL